MMVSGGDYNSIALRSDGTVWKWGLNDVGELSVGTNDNAGSGPGVDLIPHPFPAGVFHTDESGTVRMDFKPTRSIKTASQFAVTIEAKGGVDSPTLKNLVLASD